MGARHMSRLLMVMAILATGELPFRPLSDANDHFSASNLTKTYEKDPSLFLNPSAPSWLDPDELDRYGVAPFSFAPDGSTKRVWSHSFPDEVAKLSPEEKDEVTGPQAGVQVGIPSYISVPGTLLGGAILLVKVLSELF